VVPDEVFDALWDRLTETLADMRGGAYPFKYLVAQVEDSRAGRGASDVEAAILRGPFEISVSLSVIKPNRSPRLILLKDHGMVTYIPTRDLDPIRRARYQLLDALDYEA